MILHAGIISILSDSAWLTAIATLIGSFSGFFIAKSKNRTDLTISERLQLSKDQYQLIAELRNMLQEQKSELEDLREDIRMLEKSNLELSIENKNLRLEISVLNQKLEKYNEKK